MHTPADPCGVPQETHAAKAYHSRVLGLRIVLGRIVGVDYILDGWRISATRYSDSRYSLCAGSTLPRLAVANWALHKCAMRRSSEIIPMSNWIDFSRDGTAWPCQHRYRVRCAASERTAADRLVAQRWTAANRQSRSSSRHLVRAAVWHPRVDVAAVDSCDCGMSC